MNASTVFRLDIRDPSGTFVDRIADVLYLTYTRTVNSPGILQFALPADHRSTANLKANHLVHVYRKRRGYGREWELDFSTFIRRTEYAERAGTEVLTVYASGLLAFLDWRIVAYYANTSDRSAFTNLPAETIAKLLVTHNLTASATRASGRLRPGTAYPASLVSVETDAASGVSLDFFCAHQSLLKSLQTLADRADADFDLALTDVGTGAMEFRWHADQLGTDRSGGSNRVLFSRDSGTMASALYAENRLDERTAFLVVGQGIENQRDHVIVHGPTYSAGNDIEGLINATDVPRGAHTALRNRGQEKSLDFAAEYAFTYSVVQTESARYGQHYFLGDRVAAINPYTGAFIEQKVATATTSYTPDEGEKVFVELADTLSENVDFSTQTV